MQDELVFLALCDEVKVQVVDEKMDWKKVSLLGLWWRWVSDHFPTRAAFDVFTVWRKANPQSTQGGVRDFAIVVYGTPAAFSKMQHRALGQFTGRIRLSSGKGALVVDPFEDVYGHVAHFDLDLPFPGNYELEFYLDGVLSHTHTFEVAPLD